MLHWNSSWVAWSRCLLLKSQGWKYSATCVVDYFGLDWLLCLGCHLTKTMWTEKVSVLFEGLVNFQGSPIYLGSSFVAHLIFLMSCRALQSLVSWSCSCDSWLLNMWRRTCLLDDLTVKRISRHEVGPLSHRKWICSRFHREDIWHQLWLLAQRTHPTI